MTAQDPLVRALRAGGCVFAEEEAALLRAQAGDPGELAAWCARRLAGEPLEQIIGWVGFGGLRLAVGSGVFVPRQRSLLLARATVDAASGFVNPTVLETFCGVAPIAAFVRHHVAGVRIHVIDVDGVALGYARRNLGADAGVHRGPGFAGLPDALRGGSDVIAAVAPYVPDAALEQLPREARDHEPHAALLAGRDGLDHVRTLIDGAPDWLVPTGQLLMEINRAQYDVVAAHAGDAGWHTDAVASDDGQTVVARLSRSPLDP